MVDQLPSRKVLTLKECSVFELRCIGLEFFMKFSEKKSQYDPLPNNDAMKGIRDKQLLKRLMSEGEYVKIISSYALDQCTKQLKLLDLNQLIKIRLKQPEMRHVPESLSPQQRFMQEVDRHIYRSIIDRILEHNQKNVLRNDSFSSDSSATTDSLSSALQTDTRPSKYDSLNQIIESLSQKSTKADQARYLLGYDILIVLGIVSSHQDKYPQLATSWWRIVFECPTGGNSTNSFDNRRRRSVGDPESFLKKNSSIDLTQNRFAPRILQDGVSGIQKMTKQRRYPLPPSSRAVFNLENPLLPTLSRDLVGSESEQEQSPDVFMTLRSAPNPSKFADYYFKPSTDKMSSGRNRVETARSHSVKAARRALKHSGKLLVDLFINTETFALTDTRPATSPIFLYRSSNWVQYQTMPSGPLSACISNSTISGDIFEVHPATSLCQFFRPSDATAAIRQELNYEVQRHFQSKTHREFVSHTYMDSLDAESNKDCSDSEASNSAPLSEQLKDSLKKKTFLKKLGISSSNNIASQSLPPTPDSFTHKKPVANSKNGSNPFYALPESMSNNSLEKPQKSIACEDENDTRDVPMPLGKTTEKVNTKFKPEFMKMISSKQSILEKSQMTIFQEASSQNGSQESFEALHSDQAEENKSNSNSEQSSRYLTRYIASLQSSNEAQSERNATGRQSRSGSPSGDAYNVTMPATSVQTRIQDLDKGAQKSVIRRGSYSKSTANSCATQGRPPKSIPNVSEAALPPKKKSVHSDPSSSSPNFVPSKSESTEKISRMQSEPIGKSCLKKKSLKKTKTGGSDEVSETTSKKKKKKKAPIQNGQTNEASVTHTTSSSNDVAPQPLKVAPKRDTSYVLQSPAKGALVEDGRLRSNSGKLIPMDEQLVPAMGPPVVTPTIEKIQKMNELQKTKGQIKTKSGEKSTKNSTSLIGRRLKPRDSAESNNVISTKNPELFAVAWRKSPPAPSSPFLESESMLIKKRLNVKLGELPVQNLKYLICSDTSNKERKITIVDNSSPAFTLNTNVARRSAYAPTTTTPCRLKCPVTRERLSPTPGYVTMNPHANQSRNLHRFPNNRQFVDRSRLCVVMSDLMQHKQNRLSVSKMVSQ